MESTKFNVAGMTCNHCVKMLQQALGGMPGINTLDVQLTPGGKSGTVAVTYDAARVSVAQIAAAIEDQGYTAKAASAS